MLDAIQPKLPEYARAKYHRSLLGYCPKTSESIYDEKRKSHLTG
jgi:hypothetical protein